MNRKLKDGSRRWLWRLVRPVLDFSRSFRPAHRRHSHCDALEHQLRECSRLHAAIGIYRAALYDIAELSVKCDGSASEFGGIARDALQVGAKSQAVNEQTWDVHELHYRHTTRTYGGNVERTLCLSRWATRAEAEEAERQAWKSHGWEKLEPTKDGTETWIESAKVNSRAAPRVT